MKSLITVLNTTQETLQLWINGHLNELTDIASNPELVALTKNLLATHDNPANSLKSPHTLEKIRTLMATKMRCRNDEGFFIIAPDRISIASMRDVNVGVENLIHQQRKFYLDQAFMGTTLFIPSVHSDVPLIT